MCGIAGVVALDGPDPEPGTAARMRDRIVHRGPDGNGEYEAPGVSLAACRLAIVDLDPRGLMPMASADGCFHIVHNGEIYDRLELRDALIVGSKTIFDLYRPSLVVAGLARDRIDHVRHAHDAVELLRDELAAGDVVLIKGRWQQALGRVGLALAGRDVQCRADPCPFKRMLCDVCPFLDQPFTGLPGST
jgi:hypothetical protein